MDKLFWIIGVIHLHRHDRRPFCTCLGCVSFEPASEMHNLFLARQNLQFCKMLSFHNPVGGAEIVWIDSGSDISHHYESGWLKKDWCNSPSPGWSMQELLWDIYSLLCKTHLVAAANISSSIISDLSTHDVEQILTTIETSLVFHLLPLNEYRYHINEFFTLSLSGNQCQCHLYVNVTHQVAFPPIIPITRTSSPRSCGSPRVNVSVTPVSVSQVHHVALLVTTSVVWRDMGLVGVWRDTRGLSAFTTRKLGTDLRGVLVNFTKRIYFSPKWINI